MPYNLYGSIVEDIVTPHGHVFSAKIEQYPPNTYTITQTFYYEESRYHLGMIRKPSLVECLVELNRLETHYTKTPVMYTGYKDLGAMLELNLRLLVGGEDNRYYGTRDFHYFYTTLSFEDAIRTFDKYIFIRGV